MCVCDLLLVFVVYFLKMISEKASIREESEDIYDGAGKDLLQRLGIDPNSSVADTDNVNVIYRTTATKQGTIYVGDQRVAK